MFSDHTREAIVALTSIDKGVTKDEKERLDALLSGRSEEPFYHPYITYARAAKELHIPTYTVKRLVKSGRLRPVIGTGRKAIGITWNSYMSFLNGETNQ